MACNISEHLAASSQRPNHLMAPFQLRRRSQDMPQLFGHLHSHIHLDHIWVTIVIAIGV